MESISALCAPTRSILFSSCVTPTYSSFIFFFFNDTATTEIYTLSLHDALPIYFANRGLLSPPGELRPRDRAALTACRRAFRDRKSTRLNSSHTVISYAVFCLKKKKKYHITAQKQETPQL